MDRIDLHVEVVPVPFRDITSLADPEKSQAIRQRVIKARNIQSERYAHLPGIHCNAQISSKMLQQVCKIGTEGQEMLRTAMEKLNLSARAYNRILKVARTIADLDGKPGILPEHLAEAIHYRSLDRENWGSHPSP
jgi:magnesium chelatase family protein